MVTSSYSLFIMFLQSCTRSDVSEEYPFYYLTKMQSKENQFQYVLSHSPYAMPVSPSKYFEIKILS